MSQRQSLEVSEAEIAVHWQEGVFPPSPQFIAQANMTDPAVYEWSSLTTSRSASRSMPTC
jgi:acetyl-CoA synthetase